MKKIIFLIIIVLFFTGCQAKNKSVTLNNTVSNQPTGKDSISRYNIVPEPGFEIKDIIEGPHADRVVYVEEKISNINNSNNPFYYIYLKERDQAKVLLYTSPDAVCSEDNSEKCEPLFKPFAWPSDGKGIYVKDINEKNSDQVEITAYYLLDPVTKEIKLSSPAVMYSHRTSGSFSCDLCAAAVQANEKIKNRYYNSQTQTLNLPTESKLSDWYLDDNLENGQVIKISLTEHDLPLDCMIQILVSPDGQKIAYLFDNKGIWQGYLYDVKTKQSMEIPNSKELFGVRGCASKSLHSFVYNNRYLMISLGGSCEWVDGFIYDIDKNKEYHIGPLWNTATFGTNKQFLVYLETSDGKCGVKNQPGVPGCGYDMINVIDLLSGNITTLINTKKEFEISGYKINNDILNYSGIQYVSPDSEETIDKSGEINLSKISLK